MSNKEKYQDTRHHVVVHPAVVQAHVDDGVRIEAAPDLDHGILQQQQPRYLERTARRTGTAADDHQRQQDESRVRRPQVVVDGGKAGCRHHAHTGKRGMAQGLARTPRCLSVHDEHDGDRCCGNDQKQCVETKLLVAKVAQRFTAHSAQVQREVAAAQNHETDDDDLYVDALEGHDTVCIIGEAGRRHRRAGMAERVEQAHAPEHQQDRLRHGQKDVDAPQELGRAGDARRQLIRSRSRGLSTVELHAADAEDGQDRQ